MGSKVTAFHSSFWGDGANRRMAVPAKLLFIFLTTWRAPSGGAVSGIFEVGLDDMAYYTGIPAPVCKALLEGKDVKIRYEIGEDSDGADSNGPA